MRGVFVYGTLLSGFAPHETLAVGVRRIRAGTVRGFGMVHLPEGYPALFESSGVVRGELLEFESLEAVLGRFDAYEACDPGNPASLYRRRVVEVELEGDRARAWCYVYAASGLEAAVARGGVRVSGGDWRAFVEGRG